MLGLKLADEFIDGSISVEHFSEYHQIMKLDFYDFEDITYGIVKGSNNVDLILTSKCHKEIFLNISRQYGYRSDLFRFHVLDKKQNSYEDLVKYTRVISSFNSIDKELSSLAGLNYFPLLKKKVTKVTKLPELDTSIFSNDVKRYIELCSTELNVAPEAIAIPLLSSFASAVAKLHAIKPFRDQNWIVRPNVLWGLICSPPGSKKTPSIKYGLYGLENYESEQYKKYLNKKPVIDFRLAELEKEKISLLKSKKKEAHNE